MDDRTWYPVRMGLPPGMTIDAIDGAVAEIAVQPDGRVTADVRIPRPRRSVMPRFTVPRCAHCTGGELGPGPGAKPHLAWLPAVPGPALPTQRKGWPCLL